MESERSAILIKEIPAHTESEDTSVERIVWNEEVVFVARTFVHVCHHDEESRVLDMYVSVDVDDGVVAHLDIVLAIALHRKLAQSWRVVRSFIAGEVSGVGSQFHVEYLHHWELEI